MMIYALPSIYTLVGFLFAWYWRSAQAERDLRTWRTKTFEAVRAAHLCREDANAQQSEVLDLKRRLADEKKWAKEGCERSASRAEAGRQEMECFKLSSENYAKSDEELRSKLSRITDIICEAR